VANFAENIELPMHLRSMRKRVALTSSFIHDYMTMKAAMRKKEEQEKA
jgi:hypothetical protein